VTRLTVVPLRSSPIQGNDKNLWTALHPRLELQPSQIVIILWGRDCSKPLTLMGNPGVVTRTMWGRRARSLVKTNCQNCEVWTRRAMLAKETISHDHCF
jgi:hypothetical protein